MNKTLLSGLTALALVAASIITSPAAQGIGTVNVKCTNYNTAAEFSSATKDGFTTNGGVCGTAKVRVHYKTFASSPTYATAWVYSSATAVVKNPGNTVLGGSHGVDNPAGAFSSAKNFES